MLEEELAFEQFCRQFRTEDQCIAALYRFKWPNGFRCPKCGHSCAYTISTRRLPLYQCRSCRSQTSLIAGTIMEGSKTELRLWFQAIFLHCRPGGINAMSLRDILGVTYKTAWLICHKLRFAMSRRDAESLLNGNVHIMSAIYGEKRHFFATLDEHEHPIIIGASMDSEERALHLKIKIQPKSVNAFRASRWDEKPFIDEYVDQNANCVLFTPANQSDSKRNLRRLGWRAECWLMGRFGMLGSKHFQAYLDHFCYMQNRKTDTRLDCLLKDCAAFKTVTYPKLTGSNASARYRRLRQFSNQRSKTAI